MTWRNNGLLIVCYSAGSSAMNIVAMMIVVVVIRSGVWGRGHGGCWLAHVETISKCYKFCAQTAQALL